MYTSVIRPVRRVLRKWRIQKFQSVSVTLSWILNQTLPTLIHGWRKRSLWRQMSGSSGISRGGNLSIDVVTYVGCIEEGSDTLCNTRSIVLFCSEKAIVSIVSVTLFLYFCLSFSSDFEEFRNRISHSRSLTDRMLRDSKEHKHVYPAMRGNRRFLHSRIERLWIGWMQGVIVNFKPFIKSLLIKLICLRGRQIIKWPYRQKFV